MFVELYGGRPLRCSKCGSPNAVKPINSRDVAVRCGDCGHTKLTPEAEQRQLERENPDRFKAWKHDPDKEPRF